MNRYRFSLIGAGRLGRSLGYLLRASGWPVHAVATRSQASAKRAVRYIGAGRALAEITAEVAVAPLILIAVPDSAIRDVVCSIETAARDALRGRVVLHTSGALTSEELASLKKLGAKVGSLHPLQTFNGTVVPDLEGRLFAMEGDAAAIRIARTIARTLGGHPVLIDPQAKPLYHAAAAMAAGQVLALLEAAVHLFASVGMKRKEALRALLPLTRQVIENQEHFGARVAWTGPLARRDFSIIKAHQAALRSCPEEYLMAYLAVNRLAARVLARDSESVLAALDQISPALTSEILAKGVTA